MFTFCYFQFDSKSKFKGTKIVEIMSILKEYRDEAFEEIEDMTFISPKGNEITLSEEMDKMKTNKEEYKEGAIPSELEGLL